MVTCAVSIAIVLVVSLLTLPFWTTLGWGFALTALGLSWDALGAITLAFGLLHRDMALFRVQKAMLIQERALPRGFVRSLPVELAFRFGSTDVRATSPGLIDEFAERSWGLVFLGLGFLLQVFGQFVKSYGGG